MISINLPITPPIPGLHARSFEPDRDYPAMAKLLNIVYREDGRHQHFTSARLLRADQMAKFFDPPRDRFMIEVNAQTIGMGFIEDLESPEHGWLYFHSFELLPDWRGRGIGSAVLRYCQQELRTRARRRATHPAPFFQTFHIPSNNDRAIRLLTKDGYAPHRTAWKMVRPCSLPSPSIPAPPGIILRPLENEHLRQTWNAKEEAFADAFGFVPGGEDGFQQWIPQRNPSLRPDLSRIAWDKNEVVGMVLVFINEDENELLARKRALTEMICVRKPWRRSGVARSLLADGINAARDAGMHETALTVDAQNLSGAHRLYEQMGYTVQRRETSFKKQM